MSRGSLKRALSVVEYFAFGFGTMVGVGWVVLIDDWLSRGGPAGAMVGFLSAGLLLFPVALTYGRLVRSIPDAGAEIAYADGVFPPWLGFGVGWTMVLCYAIVCPWEAVALGNLMARALPAIDAFPLYEVAGKTAFAPRIALGLLLTALIAFVNYRGVRVSGVLQNVGTYGLLALFAVFSGLGLLRGEASNLQPVFAHPGLAGAGLSVLLVLQIVPYYMTGFESVAKGSEESREGFDPRGFARAIAMALAAGALFYAIAVGVVSFVFPWKTLVAEKLGTESAFERAFGARWIANLVLLAAFLSLVKIFNANFLASTRLLFALGRRGLVHPSLGAVHERHGTPHLAVAIMTALTVGGSLLGDALLIPVTEVGSLAIGLGWLSACAAFLRRTPAGGAGRRMAWAGAAVGFAIVCMKVIPGVPGSFRLHEWLVVAGWAALGWAFWALRSGLQDRRQA